MLLILAGLGAVLAVVIVLGERAGMPAPALIPADGVVGVYGPVGLAFAAPMPAEAAEKIYLRPQAGGAALAGRLAWEGNTAWFWPAQPLAEGQAYTLRLDAGISDQSGRTLRESLAWIIQVREPEVAYLAHVDAPEVWRSRADGANPYQITFTGGRVYDFAVSPSGERVAYAAENDLGGLDLWETGRAGGEPRQLLTCAADRCSGLAYAPDGRFLAYTRSQASGAGTYRPAEVWLLDLTRLDTRLLAGGGNLAASDLLWSPDGQRLAFFDENAVGEGFTAPGGIGVVNLEGSRWVVPSNGGAPGSWSPDGREIWFAGTDLSGEAVVMGLFAAEVRADGFTVRPVAWDGARFSRLGRPVWSPDSRWVALAASEAGSGAGARLWRFSPDGAALQALTAEPFYAYGSYHWDPSGAMLVFQRLELGGSQSRPQVAVWREGEVTLIAEDAALPAWLP